MTARTGPRAPTVLFFARVGDPELVSLLEFYAEDVEALRTLGFEVRVENRLWRALSARADFCLAWWWASALPVVVAWRVRRRPVVVTGASDLPDVTLLASWRVALKRALTVAAARLATANIAISEFELQLLRRAKASRCSLLHPGTDTSFFRPGPKSPLPTAVVVAQMNRLSMVRKGVDTAIQAVPSVRGRVPGFVLHVVGPMSDDGRQYLAELEARVGLAGVDVHGEVTRDEKKRFLSEAWLYVQPSLLEGFGLAVLEAMASGTAPVCSTAGSLPEVVGEAGCLLEAPTPATLADAIVSLIQDVPRREALQRAGVERARTFDRRARVTRLGGILAGLGIPGPAQVDARRQ